MALSHSRSVGSLSVLMDSNSNSRMRPKTPEKPLPRPPPSPVPLPDALEEVAEELEEEEQDDLESLIQPTTPSSATITKRVHALLELLSSERAYASDLALIRDIHIPLALGQTTPFQTTPPTPPSSGSSSRTTSTASDSSNGLTMGPPMLEKDAKIIFMNVADIAMFSDMFTERLEEALGSVLEGGTGEDHVGALFLEMIPQLAPLYGTYVTRHPTALEHLNCLPQTPALTTYLGHTRTLAQSLTHAWDLPSLLIKPVQRLLKYSLLLAAIIEETPDAHSDKDYLKEARVKMEQVAHGVNEGRRRREVVKEVLTGVPMKKPDIKAKKKGLNVNVAASVSLGRMKSIRIASLKLKDGAEGNQEAEQVARMSEELRECEVFIQTFAKEASFWSKTLMLMVEGLQKWTVSFGRVIGVTGEQQSEAFDAFHTVIVYRLLPICAKLDGVIHDQLFIQLGRLTDTTSDPERLLEAMRTLEPLHYGLLNFNVSKSRPPPQLLEASQSYVALRAQLFAELPSYLKLLHRGIVAAIMQFAAWQTEFWFAIREKWSELWDALKVEGEMQGEAAETLKVWWSRFAQVEANVAGLNIVRPPDKKDRDRDKSLTRPTTRGRGKSFSNTPMDGGIASSAVVMSTLAALDPVHMPVPSSASSQTLVASPTSTKSRHIERKSSNESLRSKHSGKSAKSSRSRPSHKYSNSNASYQPSPSLNGYPHDQNGSYTPPIKPGYQRAASMPISLPMPLRKSSSQGRLLDAQYDPYATTPETSGEHLEDDAVRGRMSRKPTIKRRITDTLDNFRPGTPTSTSRHRRSPSLPSMTHLNINTPEPSPRQASFNGRHNVSSIPSMYECRVVHPCYPPQGTQYKGLPFFVLEIGDVFDVIREEGHPSIHPELPLVLDDGEDCLLLVRNRRGELGWGLASFLLPVD
ncbi:hypothetical protein BDY19DRAFT_984428 [Irpex rosettiformis]|uniref:Uncharacterized protein n=1 Tax=Irpex rosettiformis TaxID=378272 RepID=A0ACB8U8Z7_9APHY|nr:hypothetical protein BDY19DRAFT_984428 [Irpex rosettiformis]